MRRRVREAIDTAVRAVASVIGPAPAGETVQVIDMVDDAPAMVAVFRANPYHSPISDRAFTDAQIEGRFF